MRKIKMMIMGLVMALTGAFCFSSAGAYAVTCPPGSARGEAESTVACNIPEEETGDNNNVFEGIKTVINVILSITGVMAVIMIIIGGINYITSQGDPTKTKRGRDTILYGIIGLIIALLAYSIVNFVLAGLVTKAK